MVTFIITLVVTALISVVLTRLWYELKQKNAKSDDGKIVKNTPFYATATSKMDSYCHNVRMILQAKQLTTQFMYTFQVNCRHGYTNSVCSNVLGLANLYLALL